MRTRRYILGFFAFLLFATASVQAQQAQDSTAAKPAKKSLFAAKAADTMPTVVVPPVKILEDNFGLIPEKVKPNPDNKPEKEPSKPWALSEKQKAYAQQGTAFDKNGGSGKEFKAATRNFKTATKLFEQKRRVEALPLLLEAYNVNSNNLLLNVMLGHCMVASVNTRFEGEPYVRKALEIDPNNYEARYDLARIYVSRYELDSAIMLFEQCLNLPDLDTSARLRCERRIRECRYAKAKMKKPLRVFVDNLGSTLNSIYPDYSPIVSADEEQIYFTSLRPGSVIDDLDPYTGMAFEDVYLAKRMPETDSMWMVENLGEPINTRYHDASSGISPDESTLYIYRGTSSEGDIFTAHFDQEGWQKPKRQEEGKEASGKKSHEQNIAYTFDGRTAYFVSNRAGGYGGLDIWVMHKDNNDVWQEPINLGPQVNTAYDEISVFAVPDGNTIFFSSNGHLGMGGFDIFTSRREGNDTTWTYPSNLGWPINTVEDDAFYRRSLSGKTAYYASQRMQEGFGGYDIYKITYMGEEKGVVTQGEDQLLAYIAKPVSESVSEEAVEIQITPITLLKGFVYDDYTKEPLSADVVMVDNDLQQEVAVFHSNPRTGRFMIQLPAGHNYGVTVRRSGYLFHSENFDIPATAQYQEVSKEFPLKNVSVGSRVVLRNIFFEFDKDDLLPQSFVELDRLYKLLMDAPGIKIEISGHTDNKGSASYNQKLSERRARSVVNYLVAKGIPIERLTYAGYGMTQPIASNDTDEGRALNRRTEFKIIENLDEKGVPAAEQPTAGPGPDMPVPVAE